MHPQGLRLLIGLCAAIGLAPAVPWLLATVFDTLDRGWLDSPSAFAVTIPVGLGLAAVVFALHGLGLHRALEAELEHAYETHPGHLAIASGQITAGATGVGRAVPVATQPAAVDPVAGPAGEAAADPAKQGSKMAVVERPPGSGDEKSKQSAAGDMAKKVGRRSSGRAQSMARRKFRGLFRF